MVEFYYRVRIIMESVKTLPGVWYHGDGGGGLLLL